MRSLKFLNPAAPSHGIFSEPVARDECQLGVIRISERKHLCLRLRLLNECSCPLLSLGSIDLIRAKSILTFT